MWIGIHLFRFLHKWTTTSLMHSLRTLQSSLLLPSPDSMRMPAFFPKSKSTVFNSWRKPTTDFNCSLRLAPQCVAFSSIIYYLYTPLHSSYTIVTSPSLVSHTPSNHANEPWWSLQWPEGLSSLHAMQCSAFYFSITLDSNSTFPSSINVSQKKSILGALRSLLMPCSGQNSTRISPPVGL